MILLQGNKGGVSIRLDLFGVNICFVNCHLAANKDRLAERVMVLCLYSTLMYLFNICNIFNVRMHVS